MSDAILDFIAGYAALSAYKATTITFITAIVAVGIAGVLLILRKQVLKDEDWVWYLGLAYLVLGLQYALRTAAFWAKIRAFQPQIDWNLLETLAQALLSNLNSLFFICTALALLYRLPHKWYKTKWAWLLVPFLASGVLGIVLPSPWDRFLEAFLSGICLVLVSWAMFASSGTRQRRGWAYFNLLGGFLYACLHILYAAVPRLSTWSPLAKSVSEKMKKLWLTATPTRTVEDALDAGIFGLAFISKVALFIGALLVIMRCLSAFSLAVVEQVLEPVKAKREKFLFSQGILRALAESIGADLVSLCLRLPGKRADEVLIFRWLRRPALKYGFQPEEICKRPNPGESTIGKVLAEGMFVHSHDWSKDADFAGGTGYWEYVAGMRSLVNFPLRFHGAVVGCLNFEWQKDGAFTATDVKRIRQATEFLTPIIQAERWLWALTKLRERLNSRKFIDPPYQSRSLTRFAEEIHDILSPKSTLILIDFGFRYQAAVCGGHNLPPSLLQESEQQKLEATFKALLGPDDTCVEIFLCQSKQDQVGKLFLAIERNDPLDSPSLTEDERQLDAIAALVKDAIIDQYRVHFGRVMNRLHQRLGSLDLSSYQDWWAALQDAAKEFGLLWLRFDPDKIPGSRDWLADGDGRIDFSRALEPPPLATGRYRLRNHRSSSGTVERCLELPLTASGIELYLGIARTSFEAELAEELPWGTFLERFAAAADLTLVRIRAIELETEAIRFEMNDLLVHELRSPAQEFALGVEWLQDTFRQDGQLEAGDPKLETLQTLKNSANQFLELARSVVKPSSQDRRHSVPLNEVLEAVVRFYRKRLAARAIKLLWDEDAEWMIEVPFHVAYLVLMSLVGNSQDAILETKDTMRGNITILTECTDEAVLCHVDDDGCGIPKDKQKWSFGLGNSTKPGGSGHGLPLAQRALIRHKGSLAIADQPPEGVVTRMTIVFPRSSSHER